MINERTRQLLFSCIKIRKNIHNLLVDTDITRAEYYVLLYLRELGTLRGDAKKGSFVKAADLAELLGVSRPAVTKLLNTLEEKGFIKRYVSDVDKRSTAIELTPDGFYAYQNANVNIYKLSDKLTNDLGIVETTNFIKLLEKVDGIYETLLKERLQTNNKKL
jgi:DNA-binding MarR family transcriptional regulator